MNQDGCGNCIELKIIEEEQITLEIIGDCEDMPEYAGPYTVTPRAWEEQDLETQGKRMSRNVTVREIPFVQTPTAGTNGTTVIIAS